jgi:hypothetical protein
MPVEWVTLDAMCRFGRWIANSGIWNVPGLAQSSSSSRSDTARIAAINLTPVPEKPRLLDQVRQAIRTRHYSPRTEETYVHWIKRFIFEQSCAEGREAGRWMGESHSGAKPEASVDSARKG